MTVKRSNKLKVAPGRETFELDVRRDPEIPTVQNELNLLNDDSKSLNAEVSVACGALPY